MKHAIVLVVLAARVLSAQAAPQPRSYARFDWFLYEGSDPALAHLKPRPNEYINPILTGFYPDPSLTRVGDDYYLVTSSFAYFPGVPIFHSQDLVSWTQLGHVLDRPSQLKLDSAGISRGIFAPTIRHHAGTFYMITTLVDAGGTFYVSTTNPAGPWSDPVWLPNVDGIDPSMFFDDDGKVYVLNNGPPSEPPRYEGHRAIWIQELDLAAKKTIGPRTLIVNGGVDLSKKPIWIEAPHLLKRGGAYYLIAAEGGTAEEHSEVVFRSVSVRGPYVPFRGNPILTQRHLDRSRRFPITSTGHADFVQTPKGEWWAVFLGVRPYDGDHYNTGRETYLLPVQWVNDWPVILTGARTVPYLHARPDLQSQAPPVVPTAGNFSVRDDFDGAVLAPYWNVMRTPRERWYDLTSTVGSLTIQARNADLSGRGQPSFVGRRQQHAWASASTAMYFSPTVGGGASAGLVAFQNEEHHYFLGITHNGEQTVVQLERQSGAGTGRSVVVSARLSVLAGAPVYLKIDARGKHYDFSYGIVPNQWTVLATGVDGTLLSTKVAGGFVGTYFGMYAFAPEGQP